MKIRTNLLSLLLLFSAFTVFAQEPEKTEEEESYSLGSTDDEEQVVDTIKTKNGTVIEFKIGGNDDSNKNIQTRWFTLGVGVNPVLHNGKADLPNGSAYNDWDLRTFKSTNVDLGIVQQKVNLSNHKLYLYSGLGLDMNKYMFSNQFVIDSENDSWSTTPFTANIKKNKLSATYIHVPLMLNFENNKKHYESFRINAGGFAGLHLGSNQKIKFKSKEDNTFSSKQKKIYKQKDSFNLNQFIYGLKAEVGYGPVNVYTKYHLKDLFKDSGTKNPELNTLSVGIMVVPF